MRKFFSTRFFAISYVILAFIYLGGGIIIINLYQDANSNLFEIEEKLLENEKIQATSKEDEKVLAKAIIDEWDFKSERITAQIEKELVIQYIYYLTPIALFIALLSMALPYAISNDPKNQEKIKQSSDENEPSQEKNILPSSDGNIQSQKNKKSSKKKKKKKKRKK